MQDIKYGKLVDFVHLLIDASYSSKKDICFIDATCGNGLDTLFLCKTANSNGIVKGFDIQKEAIERTNKLLKEEDVYENYELIHDSHENINKYLNTLIDCVVYNLGFLPNSSKEIKTNKDSTILSINNVLPLLKKDGRIFIIVYSLHDDGNEASALNEFVKNLDKNKYNVINQSLSNKHSSPPQLIIIENNE